MALREIPGKHNWDDYTGPRLSTNTITSRAGSLYEKLRYTLEYKDENAIRRSAIERTLRRLHLFEQEDKLGHALLMELMRAGYIENESLPIEAAVLIQETLDPYLALKRKANGMEKHALAHAATEVERVLFPVPHREAVFEAMYRSVLTYIMPKENNANMDEWRLYVYIACRRVFLQDTPQEIQYALWQLLEPDWHKVKHDREAREDVAARFDAHMRHIEHLMRSDVPMRIQARLHNESIYAEVLMDIVQTYGLETQSVLGDNVKLAERVRAFLERSYAPHKKKIARAGTRAVLYILITKVIIGMAIELPYELFVLGELNVLSIGINIFFFPLLLLAMVKTVRYPGEKNTQAVIDGLERFVTGERPHAISIRTQARSGLSKVGFTLFYLALCGITFGVILTTLVWLRFNIVSILLFLFFLMIVSYFGLRVRYKSRAWTFETGVESSKGLLWYLLFLPVTRTGRWISTHLDSVNIFVFIMDFILETPLKLLLASFDDFVSFSKEVRRDMQ